MIPILAWVQDSPEKLDIVRKFIRSLDEGSLDLLGFGKINDKFAEYFFPGISTIMTRGRYYIFVPSVCLKVESEGMFSGKEAKDKIEEYEDKICELLLQNGESEGVIGRYVGSAVVSHPSDTYWGSLRTLGIFNTNYSKSQYCTALRSLRLRREEYNNQEQEGEGIQENFWDRSIGEAIRIDISHPKSITLRITQNEAEYLKNKFEIHDEEINPSLAVWLLQKETPFSLNLTWEQLSKNVKQSTSIDPKLKYQIRLAVRFRLLAQLIEQLYYVFLCKEKWGDGSSKYSQAIELLVESSTSTTLRDYLEKSNTWLEEATEGDPFFPQIVQEVLRYKINPDQLIKSQLLWERIVDRERDKKGPKARLSHKDVLDKWTTENPQGNFPDFRRARGLQIIADIREGLYA